MEEQIVQQAPEVVAQPEPTKEDRIKENLVAMRRKLEQEEEARKAAERKAAEYEQRLQQMPQQQQPQSTQDEDYYEGDPDSYLEVKQAQKVAKKLSTKVAKADQRLAEMEQKLAYFEAMSDINNIKDFNDVVTPDNLKTLERLYPDDYQTMMTNPNLKSKSKTAYNMLKNYGILDRNMKQMEEKVAANKAKPGTAAMAGGAQQPQTPLARIGEYERRVLTDADAKRIMSDLKAKKMRG